MTLAQLFYHKSLRRPAPAAYLALLAGLTAFPPVCDATRNAQRAASSRDSGTIHISIQGAEVALDSFAISGDGADTATISRPQSPDQPPQRVTVNIANGGLTGFESDAGALGGFRLVTAAKAVQFERTGGGASSARVSIPAPEHLFPISSLAPEQLQLLIAAYDTRTGGPQSFNVVYTNEIRLTGPTFGLLTLAPAGSAVRTIGGKSTVITRFSALVPTPSGNYTAQITTDAAGHVLLYAIPSEKLIAVRAGMEDLAAGAARSDVMPAEQSFPVVVERNVRIPMRDGVALAADVYRPNRPGRFPVILQRTASGRQFVFEAQELAAHGFVYVAQDVRGRYDSGGEWRPFLDEQADGGDTVEWCSRQTWSNRRIGMTGAGYQAYTQWAAAAALNSHLKCILPIDSPSEPGIAGPYANGVMPLYGDLVWSRSLSGKKNPPFAPPLDPAALLALPASGLDQAAYGRQFDTFQQWASHPAQDVYWQPALFLDRVRAAADLPALHVAGCFSANLAGTVRNYTAMVESGHKNQRLIIGPWSGAAGFENESLEGIDLDAQSVTDLDGLALRWFEEWLRDSHNHSDSEPQATVFMRGANAWRSFPTWPPREAKQVRWYLRGADDVAGSRSRSLDTKAPDAPEPPDRYDYDPARPFRPWWLQPGTHVGMRDAHDEPTRDTLTYDSPALAADVTVAGPVTVQLAAATTAPDTDWFAALLDVSPDGSATPIAHGIVAARYRRSLTKPALLKPGEIGRYTIDLAAVGCVFQKGHRLRLVIASSCFPLYARSLNTGDDNLTTTGTAVARQSVFHEPGRMSYITLQVLAGQKR